MDPTRACPTCGRHQELCALEPCRSDGVAARVTQRPDTAWLPIDSIDEPDPSLNARQDYASEPLSELIASIREHGILQPLCVRANGERYVAIFGVRRLRAARHLGYAEVPCIIRGEAGEDAFILNLVENLQRAQLSGPERVAAIERLAATGLGVRELARRTGLDGSTISRWLRIEQRPIIKSALQAGELDIGRAKILVEAPRHALPELLARAASMNPDELRERVRASKANEHTSQPAVDSARRENATVRRALRLLRTVADCDDPALLDELGDELARLRARAGSNAARE